MRADPVDESELHAYVDGELEAEQRLRIEDHLHKHQEDAALVEGWRRQNAALRAAFAQTVKEPLPPSLRRVAKGALSGSFGSGVNWARFSPSKASSLRTLRRPDTSRRIQRRPMIAMSLLTLVVGALIAGAALLALTTPATPPAGSAVTRAASGFVERAEIAYRTFASDERLVEIGAERAPELSTWLADRTGFGGLPDLSAAGLELRGGRLAPGAQGPAGLLFYRSAEGAVVALCFERAAGERAGPPPRIAPGLEVAEWRAGGRAFVLIGPLSAEAMRAAAEIAARASR
jgi:anti-sigma factor RsiW